MILLLLFFFFILYFFILLLPPFSSFSSFTGTKNSVSPNSSSLLPYPIDNCLVFEICEYCSRVRAKPLTVSCLFFLVCSCCESNIGSLIVTRGKRKRGWEWERPERDQRKNSAEAIVFYCETSTTTKHFISHWKAMWTLKNSSLFSNPFLGKKNLSFPFKNRF